MTTTETLSNSPECSITHPFVPEDNDALNREITRLAGHINAAQYRFLVLLGALIARNAWGGEGIKSPAHWLNYYCGIDMGAAREKVRVAKALPSLPKISEAFRTGAISYAKVRAMTRSATPANEEMLLNVARHGTAQHVELLVRKYRGLQRAQDSEQAKAQYEGREFTWHYDESGMLVFRGRLPPEEGAAFLKAMHAMQEALYKKQKNVSAETFRGESGEALSRKSGSAPEPQVVGSTETDLPSATVPVPNKNVSAETSVSEESKPNYEQRHADVLVAMAEQALNTLEEGLKPQSSADKYQVVLHIERDRLDRAEDGQDAGSGPSHHCTLEHGALQFPLSPPVARRLACDASLVTVLEDEAGNVLNVGRKTRSIPPAIRRALLLRDQTCRFPGCCESRFVDAHHIKHWCDGGETKLDNLVLLCRHHHRFLHQEGYGIEKRDGEFVFVKPDGGRMECALSRQFEEGECDPQGALQIEGKHEELDLGIGPGTAVTQWGGEIMDYDMALSGLMYLEEGFSQQARPPR